MNTNHWYAIWFSNGAAIKILALFMGFTEWLLLMIIAFTYFVLGRSVPGPTSWMVTSIIAGNVFILTVYGMHVKGLPVEMEKDSGSVHE